MLASPTPRLAGFTLIELMVVIVIFSLALAVGMPLMNEWIQNAQIRTAAENIRSGLQDARTEAIRRNTSIRFRLASSGAGWTITAVSDDSTVRTMPSNEGTRNVTVATIPEGEKEVVFNGFGQPMTTLYGAALTPITRINVDSSTLSADDSRDLALVVDGGGIKMCDPNVDSEDPRACP